jgi:hypothetical protein
VSSACDGLCYGPRAWYAPLYRRFAGTLRAAPGAATFRAMPGLVSLAAVMLASGLVLSPMLISGFSLIEQQAMAWLTSAISVDTAAGSPAATDDLRHIPSRTARQAHCREQGVTYATLLTFR